METVVRELELEEATLTGPAPAREYTFEEIAELNRQAKARGLTYELADGELRQKMGGSLQQSDLIIILSTIFSQFLKNNPSTGKAFVEYGFILQQAPRRTLRFPDLAFVTQARMPEGGPPKKGYWEFTPDLAIEIVSPEDKLYEVCEKALEYVRLGVKEVWLVVPPFQSVLVYRSNQDVRYLTTKAKLESPEILPGFSVPVAELFEA